MRRADENSDELVGHDSFLDVVTNIVGILILLVMVAGLRSSQAAATSVAAGSGTSGGPPVVCQEDVRDAYRAAVESERDIHELVRRAVDSRQDAMLREQERQWLAEAVAEAEQEIADRRARLDTTDQRDFDLRRQLTEAQLKLEALTREQVALLGQEEVEEIRCEPTPIGKQVTGKEVHLHLADDHVAVIPADELIKLMTDDFDQNSWRLKQQPEMIRTIGPYRGFRVQYAFVQTQFVSRSARGGVVTGKAADFRGLLLLPEKTPIGEPAVEAMATGSQMRQFLQQRNPGRTTVTIWVYPGNYDRLRELKTALRDLGFQTAVRPLPEGCPVGFTPSGTRSVSD